MPLVVALALLAGCGGVQGEPNLAQAADNTQGQGTGRFVLDGVQKTPIERSEIHCDGALEYARGNVAIDCTVGDFDLQLKQIGGTIYYRQEGPDGYEFDGKWLKTPVEGEDELAYYSPELLLRELREASTEKERIGEENVRGSATVQYRVTIPCSEEGTLDCEGTAPVDLWIDDDGLIRRIRAEDPSAEWAYEFFDYGADIVIEPPPAADVIEETDLPGPQCAGADTAAPISVERVTTVLARHGFRVKPDTFGCSSDIAASLSNGFGSEDWILCTVGSGPGAHSGPLPMVVIGVPEEPKRIERSHANVKCTLFVDNETDEAVARLDEAFAELAQ
jgi:hypothetical protein